MCNLVYALLAEGFRVVPTAEAATEDGRLPDWLSELDNAVSGR
jgi:hypothetical protein